MGLPDNKSMGFFLGPALRLKIVRGHFNIKVTKVVWYQKFGLGTLYFKIPLFRLF
jgi:hypothetical protein